MSELKRCPFCGKEVEIKEEGDWVEVVCEDCGDLSQGDEDASIIECLGVNWKDQAKLASVDKIEDILKQMRKLEIIK